jgi:hypothetical protein
MSTEVVTMFPSADIAGPVYSFIALSNHIRSLSIAHIAAAPADDQYAAGASELTR